MNLEKKFVSFEKDELTEIGEKFYASTEILQEISEREKSIIVYYIKTGMAEISHDSLVMGGYTIGRIKDEKIEGPFNTEAKAIKRRDETIELRKKTHDILDYDFPSQIISKAVPESLFKEGELELSKYYLNSKYISSKEVGLWTPNKFDYFNVLESFERIFSNPEIEKLKQESIKLEEKFIDERFFKGVKMAAVTETKKGKSFVEFFFNKMRVSSNAPPSADNNDEGDLNKYYYPVLNISSISNYKSEEEHGNEILLLQPIDFLESLDSGCRSIRDLLDLNEDKILIE